MAAEVSVSWPTCDRADCSGARLDSGKCLAHAKVDNLDAALAEISQTGKIDARGVTISVALMGKILDAVPLDPEGRRRFADVMFDGATFEGDAWFKEATFARDAGFKSATFQGDAVFSGAVFQGDAWFDWATFQGDAWLGGATFQRDAGFNNATFHGGTTFGATFEGEAWFSWVTFEGAVGFNNATFQRGAGFLGATFHDHGGFVGAIFQDDTGFTSATFQRDARFDDATFQGGAFFSGATFRRAANFSLAVFGRAQNFGPLLACRGLDLDGVQFSQPVVIEASTTGLCCRRARFAGGVQFRLRWARLVLDDTDLSVPSLITGIPRLANNDAAAAEERIARAWTRLLAGRVSEQPRLLSLRRANVAALGLSNVSLADCRYAGAHNLDQLRLEADVTLALSPARAGWERRQVIAEESAWRAGRWAAPQWPGWAGDEPAPMDPAAIAGLYRALRKGREDAKDEPGAADFYYGEMEMRRHAKKRVGDRESGARGRVDRSVLTTYWLVSGYGLRAWRAITWLAAVTAVIALAFHLAGFSGPSQPASYWTSLLYAFRSTLSLSDNAVKLTVWGQLLQALLRLTGPVLLGLALLALRGRVKR